ncbi:MAG: hypothetical protein AAFQ41_02685 [Cyanobacteria bacterium J06623_7]
MMSSVILIQLEETLLSIDSSRRQNLTEKIAQLQQQDTPVICLTSKTRAEVADWMLVVGLKSPLVVEAGSGIFIADGDRHFATPDCVRLDNYQLHQLGCTYTEARAALKAVQEEINKILRGFGDMDEAAIQTLLNTSKVTARQVKAREFSEYFLTPNRLEIAQLQQVAQEYGFKIVPGSQLSLILGGKADLATAVRWLKQQYRSSQGSFRFVGLGCTEGDLSWLETVDFPLVIPHCDGAPVNLERQDGQIIDRSGIEGWLKAIAQLDSIS